MHISNFCEMIPFDFGLQIKNTALAIPTSLFLTSVEIINMTNCQWCCRYGTNALAVLPFLSVSGLLSEEHSEEHGLHLPQRQSLCHKQSDKKPLSVLPTAEMPGCGNVERV